MKAWPGDPRAASVRRVLYAIEEPLELHLSVLEGIQDRFETPFFDNLKKYARRPISTFHALPIARGKSVFKSDWIRDMGEFYGINLFLAESSATTGGLDSLLEPTGNIKRAQEMAARAFGADRVVFRDQRHQHLEQDGASRRWWRRATSSSSTAIATSRTTTASCSPAGSRSTSRRFR